MSNEVSNNSFGMFQLYQDGFIIELQQQKRKVIWDDIESINASKVDMMTFDVICIDIILEKTFITITEDISGWKEFIEKLQLQFSSIDNKWFGETAFPSFETNCITIYKR